VPEQSGPKSWRLLRPLRGELDPHLTCRLGRGENLSLKGCSIVYKIVIEILIEIVSEIVIEN